MFTPVVIEPLRAMRTNNSSWIKREGSSNQITNLAHLIGRICIVLVMFNHYSENINSTYKSYASLYLYTEYASISSHVNAWLIYVNIVWRRCAFRSSRCWSELSTLGM